MAKIPAPAVKIVPAQPVISVPAPGLNAVPTVTIGTPVIAVTADGTKTLPALDAYQIVIVVVPCWGRPDCRTSERVAALLDARPVIKKLDLQMIVLTVVLMMELGLALSLLLARMVFKIKARQALTAEGRARLVRNAPKIQIAHISMHHVMSLAVLPKVNASAGYAKNLQVAAFRAERLS